MDTLGTSPVLLVHHASDGRHTCPPNSICGLQACLEAGARAIEMDISPLADGDFLLLHGPLLDKSTNSSGPVNERTADGIRDLRLTRQGIVTDEPVGLLNQALELVGQHPHPVELQLDLKPHAPLNDAILSRLVKSLQPVKDRVRVTSMADWALRRLHTLDPDLALGFDPLLYLDVGPPANSPEYKNRDPARPPFRLGVFGYWDDHPLSSRRWAPTADYLAARAEALWAQVPPGAIWYIRAALLARTLDDGFDWFADLHDRGAEVDAWTIDPDRPEHVALARRLVDAGVDRITSNDAPSLAEALGERVAF